MTVLHLLAPSPVGGLEAVVESLARGQRGRGVDVHVGAVVEPEARPHPFVGGLLAADMPVAPLVVPHRAYLTEMRALRQLLDRVDPDVVHTHGYRADVLGGFVARRAARPLVSTIHGFTGGGRKNRVYEWLQRRSLLRFDAVAAVSRPLGRELAETGLDVDRLHLVPNAWSPSHDVLRRGDARRRLGLPEGAFVVGWVGRLSREKGADVLLRAVARTADRPPMLASLVGDGAQEESLRELASELGIADAVRFHGRVPDAAELYRAFDVFVLSSRTEGTPVSLFEAVEAGVPVVATRVGGVPDVAADGEHALLVPPEEPEVLARAVARVREDPDGAEERARRARCRLQEEFAVEPWLDRYQAIYRDVRDRTGAAA